jgi:VanZ family protein
VRVLRAVDPWLWPPLLMAVIFVLSAQPDLSTGLGLADLVARKIAHGLIYAALCVAWWRLLVGRLSLPQALLVAFGLTVAYAVVDEWHQGFVPGRSPSVIDVGIDALGAGLAAVARLRAARRRPRAPTT